MNICKLPLVILEKILFEGNYYHVSKVCLSWREIAQNNKSKFNEINFDLAKDNPKDVDKKNPNIVYIYRSQIIDENGFYCNKDTNTSIYYNDNNLVVYRYVEYIFEKFKKFLNNILSLNTLNVVFNSLILINTENNIYKKYILSENFIKNNQKVSGIIYYNLFLNFNNYFEFFKKFKIKVLNIKVINNYNIIKNIDENFFFNNEILMLSEIIINQTFINFEKFTFNAPNNTYLIYDQIKKLLIIRYGNYEKYNLPSETTHICQICSKNFRFCGDHNHKHYNIKCFKSLCYETFYDFYPARLIRINYDKLLKIKTVEKLIIISTEFYEFIFDQLLETSNQEKYVEYYCLDQSKTEKITRGNFVFVPVQKEKEKYYFDTMHFSFFEKNIF